MDIEDTLHEMLHKFVKQIHPQSNQDYEPHIEQMKWQLLCIFASAQNIYDAPISMEENPIQQQR